MTTLTDEFVDFLIDNHWYFSIAESWTFLELNIVSCWNQSTWLGQCWWNIPHERCLLKRAGQLDHCSASLWPIEAAAVEVEEPSLYECRQAQLSVLNQSIWIHVCGSFRAHTKKIYLQILNNSNSNPCKNKIILPLPPKFPTRSRISSEFPIE